MPKTRGTTKETSGASSSRQTGRSRERSTVRMRALSERMYLLSRLPVEDNQATFLVCGVSGKLYTVRLPVVDDVMLKPRCNCPDYIFRRRACKHLVFVALRVLKLDVKLQRLPQSDEMAVTLGALIDAHDQVARLVDVHGTENDDVLPPGEVRRAFELAVPSQFSQPHHHAGHEHCDGEDTGGVKEVKQKEVGPDDECPICFETLLDPENANSSGSEDNHLVFCKIGCGNPVHESCMKTYAAAISDTVRCVLCRSPWVFPGDTLSGPNGTTDESRIGNRGLLMNGSLIDLSVIAADSFPTGPAPRYVYSRAAVDDEDEADDDDDDDDDYHEIAMSQVESQSEKALRQKSERAERARKRGETTTETRNAPSSSRSSGRSRARGSRNTRATSKRSSPTVSKRVSKRAASRKSAPSKRGTRANSKAVTTPLRRSARTSLGRSA